MLPICLPSRWRLARFALAAVSALLIDSAVVSPNRAEPAQARQKADKTAVGSSAPDFQLPELTGKGAVRISKLRGRPVVLWFGSYTCQPFRGSVLKMERLYSTDKSKAKFFIVYTREAHPSDADQEFIRHVRSEKDRRNAARALQKEMRLTVPILVDRMDDRVERVYDAPGARIYVIDKAGKITFRTSVPAEPIEVAQAAEALQRAL